VIKIYPNTKVYIAAPAAAATGGPELLHQLAFHLNNEGIKAYMYYYPSNHPNPIHPNYKEYNTLGEKFPLSQTFHINKKTAGLL
jgi:hypothetical protein